MRDGDEGDATSRLLDRGAPILVYLDQGDLAAISDGEATGVEDLRLAFVEASAQLLVSSAHLLDLAKADRPTKNRWVDAVYSLGTVRFAAEPGAGREIDPTSLELLMNDTDEDVRAFTDVATMRHGIATVARDAHLTTPPQLSEAALRNIVESILDGTIHEETGLTPEIIAEHFPASAQMRALPESLGLDREAILSSLIPQLEPVIARGDLAELVRIQRARDSQRKPRFSDTADELHLKFAVHADIVTVDRNVAHSMRPVIGKRVPVDGRGERGASTKVVLLRTRNLDAVSHAVRSLAAAR